MMTIMALLVRKVMYFIPFSLDFVIIQIHAIIIYASHITSSFVGIPLHTQLFLAPHIPIDSILFAVIVEVTSVVVNGTKLALTFG